MLQGLVHAHSGIRWIALILLITAVVNAFIKRKSGTFSEKDRKLSLFTMVSLHIQLVLGMVLYFMSPKVAYVEGFMKDTVLRFYAVEHIVMMVVAIALVTVGYIQVKKDTEDAQKFKDISVCYLTGLIIILAAIPWPFRNLGATWF